MKFHDKATKKKKKATKQQSLQPIESELSDFTHSRFLDRNSLENDHHSGCFSANNNDSIPDTSHPEVSNQNYHLSYLRRGYIPGVWAWRNHPFSLTRRGISAGSFDDSIDKFVPSTLQIFPRPQSCFLSRVRHVSWLSPALSSSPVLPSVIRRRQRNNEQLATSSMTYCYPTWWGWWQKRPWEG